jgi:hypothetical protein
MSIRTQSGSIRKESRNNVSLVVVEHIVYRHRA